MGMGEYRATPRRENSPKARTRSESSSESRSESSAALQLRSMVDDQPWVMVGAAAGAGLVLGSQSRRLAQSRTWEMLLATLGGVAVRLATGALAQWLEAQRERR